MLIGFWGKKFLGIVLWSPLQGCTKGQLSQVANVLSSSNNTTCMGNCSNKGAINLLKGQLSYT